MSIKQTERTGRGVDLHRGCFTSAILAENGRFYLRKWKLKDLEKFVGTLLSDDKVAVKMTTNVRLFWDTITGLSGSGKTTLAKALLPHLPQPRLLLDGDEMREALSPLAGGYAAKDRRSLAETYARLCLLAARQGTTVVCATISMFRSVREWNRLNLPGYFEIYLEAAPEVLRERDYKGVYRDSGQNVVGHSIQPELPENPDITFQQGTLPPKAMADEILAAIAVTSPPNSVPERPLCRASP